MSIVKEFIKNKLSEFGFDIVDRKKFTHKTGSLDKADSGDFLGRFREIVSDPLNLLIKRVPNSGYVDESNCIILHNGNRVPATGKYSYSREFSQILIINRGVHEPLEEYVFQQMLQGIKNTKPIMIELGSYWAHYSMWLKKIYPDSRCIMVEANRLFLESGKNNFSLNGYSGEFINQFVSSDGFQMDAFASEHNLPRIDILHSDIQGYEVEMLNGAKNLLANHLIDYIFISTHSEKLHDEVRTQLINYGYHIEASSSFDTQTTSCDGLILATSPHISPLLEGFAPLGRLEILQSEPNELICSINKVQRIQT
jgi:hypothetical protein